MALEATGTVHDVSSAVKVSDRFTKREFVLSIADNPKYPQLVQFQATGDRCSQLDDVRPGDVVRVEFNLRGREWRSPKGEVKFFNSLDVWRVEVKDKSGREPEPMPGGGGAGPDDDIPF